MKILYSHYLTDANHPAVQMIEHISRELRTMGHQVSVHPSAGLETPQTVPSTGVAKASVAKAESRSDSRSRLGPPTPSLIARTKNLVWFSKAIARNFKRQAGDCQAIRDFQPDVVLARHDAYCWSMHQAAKVTGVPCVTYADAPVAYESRVFDSTDRFHPPGVVERIERWCLKAGKAVITVSHPAKRQLMRYGLQTPIHVNPNGVDVERFHVRTEQERSEIKNSLGIPPNHTVIGFLGTFKSFHGIDRLRDLILEFGQQREITWLLVGDGPERPAVEQAVRNRSQSKLLFMGRQPGSEMGRLLAAMDIAIAPHSQMKGDFYFCPLKILEYAASGCATVASDQGDIPMLLADGEGGEIVPNDQLESWKDAINRLIHDTEYRKRLSNAAQQHVLHRLTWTKTAERVDAVLADVIGDDPPTAAASLDENKVRAESDI